MANNIRGCVKVGGTRYYSAYQAVTTSWASKTFSWTTNPKTGAAWTVDDVNGSGANALQQFGITCYAGTSADYWNVYTAQVYVKITYAGSSGVAGGSCGSAGVGGFAMGRPFSAGSA